MFTTVVIVKWLLTPCWAFIHKMRIFWVLWIWRRLSGTSSVQWTNTRCSGLCCKRTRINCRPIFTKNRKFLVVSCRSVQNKFKAWKKSRLRWMRQGRRGCCWRSREGTSQERRRLSSMILMKIGMLHDIILYNLTTIGRQGLKLCSRGNSNFNSRTNSLRNKRVRIH